MRVNYGFTLIIITTILLILPFVVCSRKLEHVLKKDEIKRQWTEGFRPSVFQGNFNHSLSEASNVFGKEFSRVNVSQNNVESLKDNSTQDLSVKESKKNNIKDSQKKAPRKQQPNKRQKRPTDETIFYTPKKRYRTNIYKTNEMVFGPGGLNKNTIDHAVRMFGDATIGRETGRRILNAATLLFTGTSTVNSLDAEDGSTTTPNPPTSSKTTKLPKPKSKMKIPEKLKNTFNSIQANSKFDKRSRAIPGLLHLLSMTLIG